MVQKPMRLGKSGCGAIKPSAGPAKTGPVKPDTTKKK